jgi:hypothetical protein
VRYWLNVPDTGAQAMPGQENRDFLVPYKFFCDRARRCGHSASSNDQKLHVPI